MLSGADSSVSEGRPDISPDMQGTSGGDIVNVFPWRTSWILTLSFAALANALLLYLNHGKAGFFLPVVACVCCSLAAVFDALVQRIPNQITYTAVVLGLGLNLLGPAFHAMHLDVANVWLGTAAPRDVLYGFGVCALAMVLAGFFPAMGQGDLKLLAALASLLGLLNMANVVILALVLAFGYALVNLALFGRLNLVYRIAAQRLMEFFFLGRMHTPLPQEKHRFDIPLAIPLAAATVACFCYRVYGVMAGGVP
jgi:prepilin signal peptidase PulO-like enzyme (type II secretory pathway)